MYRLASSTSLFVFLCLAFATTTANAQQIDQVSDPGGLNLNMGSANLFWQQEIKSGVNGVLGGIDVWFQAADGEVNVSLFRGNGWQTGSPEFTKHFVTPGVNGWQFLDLSEANFTLAPEETFVVQFHPIEGPGTLNSRASTPGAYSRGGLFLNGGKSGNPTNDLAFRTHMLPRPEIGGKVKVEMLAHVINYIDPDNVTGNITEINDDVHITLTYDIHAATRFPNGGSSASNFDFEQGEADFRVTVGDYTWKHDFNNSDLRVRTFNDSGSSVSDRFDSSSQSNDETTFPFAQSGTNYFNFQLIDNFDNTFLSNTDLPDGDKVVDTSMLSLANGIIQARDTQFNNIWSIVYNIDEVTFSWIPDTVSTTNFSVSQGQFVSGTVGELSSSDDTDVVARRSSTDIQSRTEFVIECLSPSSTLAELEFTLEASVFARTDVRQDISLYNYETFQYELVDSRMASRFQDTVVSVVPTGDPSRFVDQFDQRMRARVLFQSTNPRQSFSSSIDHAFWSIR